jgi:hypothetical protein
MNLPALTELKRVAKEIPPGLLDMSTYGDARDPDSKGCLATWATRDDWFRSRGYVAMEAIRPKARETEGAYAYVIPSYKDFRGRDASKHFFGITYDQEKSLFGPRKINPTIANLLRLIDNVTSKTPTPAPPPTAA